MKILIATECLRTGGAQVFALRLAKALQDQGHQVYYFYHYQDYINIDLVKKVFPNVKLFYPEIPGLLDWFVRKTDRLFYKLGIDVHFRHILVTRYIRKLIKKYQIEVAHSNMFQSDYVFAKALKGNNIPLVITMHGSYESFLNKYFTKAKEGYLNFDKKLKITLSRVNAVAYLTEKNLEVFKHPEVLSKEDCDHINFGKIYNGFSGWFTEPLTKAAIGIPENHLVFGMVARGIPEKGWETAIKSFIALSNPHTALVLVGWSEYIEELKNKYSTEKNIFFAGHSGNPLDWIHAFDVGLLPSTYGESLPNVIVEYLFCTKPVITTNVGESGKMITTDESEIAGYIIEEQDTRLIQKALTARMKDCVTEIANLHKMKALTRECFERFDMKGCVESYEKLYQKALLK